MILNFKTFESEAADWLSSYDEPDQDFLSYRDDDDYNDFDDDDYEIIHPDDDDDDYSPSYMNYEYKEREEVIYKGNSKGKNNKEAKVEKFRDDGKIVIRFNDDNFLLAVRKQNIIPKVEREMPKPDIKEDTIIPGQKWWEKNKNK